MSQATGKAKGPVSTLGSSKFATTGTGQGGRKRKREQAVTSRQLQVGSAKDRRGGAGGGRVQGAAALQPQSTLG